MNGKMYEHSATIKNRSVLSDRGVTFIEPVIGELACGYEGVGKLAPIPTILSAVSRVLS
jgi:phosphopantothenoylcysteine decarboxylase/phosphopantothenoylcysteine decarboxylase/phosphopantothenate--cysteine ligase